MPHQGGLQTPWSSSLVNFGTQWAGPRLTTSALVILWKIQSTRCESRHWVHCIQDGTMERPGAGCHRRAGQLAGIDAAGLISMIVQAVQTVQRNKVECQLLVNHVMMISDLLQLLQQSEMMRRPEIRRPIDGLEDTLRQAYMLITSCQKSNVMYRFIMAGNQAQQFRDVRDRIDSYLRIYPLISHLDTRYFITGLYSQTHPSGAEPQASQEVLGSSTGHSHPDSRSEGSASSNNGIESVEVQAGIEPLEVQVQQNDGYRNTEVWPNRKHRFGWLSRWTRTENRSIDRLISQVRTGCFTVFKFSQLAASTNNFSFLNVIGRGGFGTVYKGVLPTGADVAIKISSSQTKYQIDYFETEVLIMSKLQHANIVKLLGCCIEGDNSILVYEYVRNGSLYNRIHVAELRAGMSLSWPIRFQIIEGIVQGAAYLNHHSRPRVVHRDLKTANILLDCDMTPRLIDFGLAVVLSSDEDEKEDRVVGTMGYLDTHYARTGNVSIKTDVFAFGVILLEIITAQHAFSVEPERLLAQYAWELWSSGRSMELIDPLLHDEPRISDILRCIQIALLCVQDKPECRPTMSDVLIMLKCESMTLPVPRPPGVFVPSLSRASEASGSATPMQQVQS
ncbi:hypothetical protein EJB05_26010 [Eragrostis curvula]|uniref:Protein kinase domain-containing protein n=1 Tax=Eragrostis curvula TaxID=38414 RepID=A0A5J9UJJ3_9POAL|nr:hypothetical protein EJB05_26010 [Eragrostis curvula]